MDGKLVSKVVKEYQEGKLEGYVVKVEPLLNGTDSPHADDTRQASCYVSLFINTPSFGLNMQSVLHSTWHQVPSERKTTHPCICNLHTHNCCVNNTKKLKWEKNRRGIGGFFFAILSPVSMLSGNNVKLGYVFWVIKAQCKNFSPTCPGLS